MNVVLYTRTLRPLAILHLTEEEVSRLRYGVCIARLVRHKPDPPRLKVVPLVGERLRLGQHETFVLFAANESDEAPLRRHYQED